MRDFERQLLAALAADVKIAGRDAAREQDRRAGVLALFAWSHAAREPRLLLVQRADDGGVHGGQMAFPGGMHETQDADTRATALREAREEVGIDAAEVRVLGRLPDVLTVTRIAVTPWVAVCGRDADAVELRPDPREVSAAVWAGLGELRRVYRAEAMRLGELQYTTHVYPLGPGGRHRVWGATGAMIKNLLDRLAAVA